MKTVVLVAVALAFTGVALVAAAPTAAATCLPKDCPVIWDCKVTYERVGDMDVPTGVVCYY